MFRALTTVALALALLSGCFGLPEGAADTGDLVTIRYTATDLDSGATLRSNRSVSFDVGSGASGLGLQVERAVRGHQAGDTFTVTVRDDPSLDFTQVVEVNRSLAPIPIHQEAPREDFVSFVGEPTIGLAFPAYGIYQGVVTGASNETVEFRVEAEDGQRDPVPSVGAVLVTTVGTATLERTLEPVANATFTIAPPSPFQPNTPLGLEPGAYKVLGASADKLRLARSSSPEADLVGKDLRVTVTLVAVTPAGDAVPADGNFGSRRSPVLNGDPESALAGTAGEGEDDHAADDGHGH